MQLKRKVEVYCGIWSGHCEGCEVGSGMSMTHRIDCTGPDWATGKHTILIDADDPYAKNEDHLYKPEKE
jgi:proline racemase